MQANASKRSGARPPQQKRVVPARQKQINKLRVSKAKQALVDALTDADGVLDKRARHAEVTGGNGVRPNLPTQTASEIQAIPWNDTSDDARLRTSQRRKAIGDLAEVGITDADDISALLMAPWPLGLGYAVPRSTVYADLSVWRKSCQENCRIMHKFGMETVLARFNKLDQAIGLKLIANPTDLDLVYARLAITDRLVSLYGLSAKDRLAAGKVDGPLNAGDVDVLLAKADAMDAVTVDVDVRRDPSRSLFDPTKPRPGRTHALGLPVRAAIHKDTDGDESSNRADTPDDEPTV